MTKIYWFDKLGCLVYNPPSFYPVMVFVCENDGEWGAYVRITRRYSIPLETGDSQDLVYSLLRYKLSSMYPDAWHFNVDMEKYDSFIAELPFDFKSLT